MARWVAILGGNYAISDDGRVQRLTAGRRTYAGKMLKLTPKTCGYLKVSPVVNGKNVHYYVHDLVAEHFIGPKPDGFEVNHKNGNKHDNLWTNLEYVTHADNMDHAGRTGLCSTGERHHGVKLTDAQVIEIRMRRLSGESVTSLASEFGVAASTLSQVANGVRRRTA